MGWISQLPVLQGPDPMAMVLVINPTPLTAQHHHALDTVHQRTRPRVLGEELDGNNPTD